MYNEIELFKSTCMHYSVLYKEVKNCIVFRIILILVTTILMVVGHNKFDLFPAICLAAMTACAFSLLWIAAEAREGYNTHNFNLLKQIRVCMWLKKQAVKEKTY